MFPYIELFGKQISLYALMALSGFLTAGFLACACTRKRGKDEDDMIVFFLIAALGALLGSHFLYGLLNIDLIVKLLQDLSVINSVESFFRIVLTIFGGGVFYGGLIGGGITGMLYIKKKNLDTAFYCDVAAFSVPLFHTFGRIGCFLGGCCYGIPSTFGFTYTQAPIPQANGVQRFPIQLIEALFNLLLFFIIFYLYKKCRYPGKLIYIYLTAYPAARILFEFFRGDEYRGFLFGLSTSQIISILILISESAFLFIQKFKRADKQC